VANGISPVGSGIVPKDYLKQSRTGQYAWGFYCLRKAVKKSIRGWWIIQSEKMVLGGCPRIDIFPKSGRVGSVNKVMSLISKAVSVM
jgi:hypothetical protein